MVVNVAVALLHALKVAVKEAGSAAGKLNPATDKILQELLQVSDIVLLAPTKLTILEIHHRH